jgi:NADP-dependent aldehyde dehydrogenase
MSPETRADLLDMVATAVDDDSASLIAIAKGETALEHDRLSGEVARTTGQLRLFASVLREGSYLEATIDHADPSTTPPRPDLRRQLIPLGPVAVFTASNFPFAFSVAGGDTASALAAGCPVVVKGHSAHPRLSRATATVVQDALSSAGAPDGTLTHVEGRATGSSLVVNPVIRAVAFTGSLAGGRTLLDLISTRPDPIPFYGELSSINPVVVTPNAAANRAEEIANGLLRSFTLGVGQFCTKPGLVFVPADSEIIPLLAEAVTHAEPAKMLTPGIQNSFTQTVAQLSHIPGVEIAAGSVDVSDVTLATPLALTLDAGPFLSSAKALTEECFGPAVVVVQYRGTEELDRCIAHLPGALTATLHAEAEDMDTLHSLVEQLGSRVGRLILNGWPTGVAVTWSMHHGGPWPATTNPLHTSVGATSIRRFQRPITYQGEWGGLLPPALQDANPLRIPRRVDGQMIP